MIMPMLKKKMLKKMQQQMKHQMQQKMKHLQDQKIQKLSEANILNSGILNEKTRLKERQRFVLIWATTQRVSLVK
jgi:hypothetical protein